MIVFIYFLREVVPQFFTTLCVISSILVVSQLVRLSEVLVTFGITAENVLLPFLFIILPFLSFTIPISYLFAVLIGFSRLSIDGEFTALLAAGYSLTRAAKPIMGVALFLYFVGAVCALNLEPWGRRELVDFYKRKAQTELDNMIKFKLASGVFMEDFLGFTLYAEEISPDRSSFTNVLLAPKARENQNFTLLAPSGAIIGSASTGDLRMSFDYGVIYSGQVDSKHSSILKFKRAEIDLVKIFQQQIYGSGVEEDDYRALPPMELWSYIEDVKKNKDSSEKDLSLYLKARFLFHQRLAIPFAAVTFALFAMVLGIQDQRKGKGSAYLGAMLTIIGGYVFMMGFKWLGENGYANAPLAAWLPNLLLLLFGGFLVYQKNRLPPSEGTLDPGNIPWIAKRWPKSPVS